MLKRTTQYRGAGSSPSTPRRSGWGSVGTRRPETRFRPIGGTIY